MQLAKPLLMTRIVMLALALGCVGGASCVIPPALDPEQDVDAAVNSIPVIVKLDSNFPSPGPIPIKKPGTGEEQEPMTITVRDLDVQDTVWIYIYVDYNYPNPLPHLSSCQSSVSQFDRDLTCPLNTLCAFADQRALHFLEAMVTDRELLPQGEPLFRALPPNAGVSYRSWLMVCTE